MLRSQQVLRSLFGLWFVATPPLLGMHQTSILGHRMSFREAKAPNCDRRDGLIDVVIEGPLHDIGEFSVRRVLPSSLRQSVGPYLFFDHMGPAEFPPGAGVNVRPHPHINLATITYLFAGEIEHRDSLGSQQTIQPGAINWMTAGRGIVHSERTPAPLLESGYHLHGIQLWLGLPTEHEEVEPAFFHHPADSLPRVERDGALLRVLVGSAYGVSSPVKTFSPMLYVDVELAADAEIELPSDCEELAVYVAAGSIDCCDETVDTPKMLVFTPGAKPSVRANRAARLLILGGAPLDGHRHKWWNFVSSRRDRIEAAKLDWKEGRFPLVPGDEKERIPLP